LSRVFENTLYIIYYRERKETDKMPFNELQRRDSWPPTIVRIPPPSSSDLTFDPSVLDADPISFFLTAPEDIDDFLSDEELSAGIETGSKAPVIREISPSSLQRVPRLDEEDEDEEEFEAPMTLKDFTAKHNSGRTSRSGHYSESEKKNGGLGLGITLPEHAAMRGRARVKLIPEGRGRGRGRARTLSARRPQSWREPSPEIWRIEEEREDELNGNEKAKVVGGEAMGRSVSTPGSVGGGILKGSPAWSASPSPGPKKRVHWADV
jgi:hypothetical protein